MTVPGLRYLLDTNVISERVRPSPNANIIARLTHHQSEVAIGAPTWHEAAYGYRRLPPSRRRAEVQGYFEEVVRATIPILPYDVAAADWHAAERARLVSLGRTPPYIDGQIAAIAVTNDLILVTANTAGFAAFADLQVEDWRS